MLIAKRYAGDKRWAGRVCGISPLRTVRQDHASSIRLSGSCAHFGSTYTKIIRKSEQKMTEKVKGFLMHSVGDNESGDSGHRTIVQAGISDLILGKGRFCNKSCTGPGNYELENSLCFQQAL